MKRQAAGGTGMTGVGPGLGNTVNQDAHFGFLAGGGVGDGDQPLPLQGTFTSLTASWEWGKPETHWVTHRETGGNSPREDIREDSNYTAQGCAL